MSNRRRRLAIALTSLSIPCALAALALAGAKAGAHARAAAPQDQGVKWTQRELEAASIEVQRDVEDLRGEKFKQTVPVKLSSKDQFVAYALARTKEMEPEAKRTSDETVQKMLGLIPDDMDLLAESMRLLGDQVGGFYDPSTKTFYLMDNCPQGLARIVLSHELGHALDDQLYDIDGTLKKLSDKSDMTLAYQAVVEGSGTAVMGRWSAGHVKMMDLLGFSKMEEEQTASMARSPTVLWKPLLAAYLKGQAFLARTESIFTSQKEPPTNADIDQAFRAPPRSTEQILHPEKYWNHGKGDEPIAVQQDAEHLPDGWEVLRRDVIGEMLIAIWCIAPAEQAATAAQDARNAISIPYTNAAASGWGGDELVLLGKEAARAVRWVTVWDTERDAAEFFGAASMIVDGLEARLAKLTRGKTAQTKASIRYGGEREVVIELGYGAKRADWDKLFQAFGER